MSLYYAVTESFYGSPTCSFYNDFKILGFTLWLVGLVVFVTNRPLYIGPIFVNPFQISWCNILIQWRIVSLCYVYTCWYTYSPEVFYFYFTSLSQIILNLIKVLLHPLSIYVMWSYLLSIESQQDGRYFADAIFKYITLYENKWKPNVVWDHVLAQDRQANFTKEW